METTSQPAKSFKWRKWNNILHRDIGYIIVGMTVIYGISGLAVNHIADWNPNFKVEKKKSTITPIVAETREDMVQQAREALHLEEEPMNVFRPDKESLQLFYEDKTYSIDLPTGSVILEHRTSRHVLREFNQLHLNAPKGIWTYLADVYAVSLVFVAITGLFVLKGKNGITGRGAWLTALGILIPLSYWIYYLYS